jgi:hypothetical protein
MDAKDFLHRVLPHSDGYFYGALVANGKFHQHKFNDIQALIRYADSCKEKRCDVYFATGSFSEKRTASDCRNKRALYLDIDTGHGKLYSTKKDAVRALFDFCDERFIRPNILVDSGGGIHAYWTFTHEISTENWVKMAEALKSLCETYGLAADPTVTADAARILRIPGTYNVKEGTPRQVKVIHATTKEFKPKRLQKLLGQVKSEALSKLGSLAQEMDLEFAASGEGIPFFAGKIIERCNVLKHTYETGGEGQVEPLWMAQLSLMAYAADGSEFIHSLSDQHKDYDYRRTEKKYSQRLAVKESGKYGPPLCKTLGMYLHEKCKACRFNGRIKSPIVLGRETDGTEIPFPYKQDDKAIYRLENKENENGEVESKAVKVLSFAIEDFQLFSSPDPSQGMVYRFSVDKYGAKQATFTTSAMADKRKLLVELSNSDIPLQGHEYQEFTKLMTTWADKMIQAKQVGQPTLALGWTKHEKGPAFTLINKTITKEEGDKEVTFLDREFVKDFTPTGGREAWLELSHYLTQENRHAITAGILSAFAAPLISFTGVNGCVLALVSDKSGTGKSTALRTAQAVWGDPRRGVNALDDTPLSVANRMGRLNNLPAFWDELRMKDQVEKFVLLMFQVSQGKERSRLRSNITTQHVGTWNTLITVASNESITDHVRHLVHGTDAGLLRVFEVTVPYLQRQQDIDRLVAALDNNFGIIGGEYAEWLVSNYDKLLPLLEKVKLQFSKRVHADSAERFWVATCASLLTAAIITNRLKFTAIGIPQFTDWLVKEFLRSRAEQTMDFDPIEIRAKKYLFQFLDIHKDQLVVFDRLSGKGVASVGTLHSPLPRGEILGVYAKEDKKVRIKRAPFVEWVYEHHKEPHTRLVQALLSQKCVERRASVSVGIANAVHSRDAVIDIPLDEPEFSDVLDHIDAVVTDAET